MDFYSLGILLIALRGLNTRTVRIAERFNFSTSRQYSRQLEKEVVNGIHTAQISRIKKEKSRNYKIIRITETDENF